MAALEHIKNMRKMHEEKIAELDEWKSIEVYQPKVLLKKYNINNLPTDKELIKLEENEEDQK